MASSLAWHIIAFGESGQRNHGSVLTMTQDPDEEVYDEEQQDREAEVA